MKRSRKPQEVVASPLGSDAEARKAARSGAARRRAGKPAAKLVAPAQVEAALLTEAPKKKRRTSGRADEQGDDAGPAAVAAEEASPEAGAAAVGARKKKAKKRHGDAAEEATSTSKQAFSTTAAATSGSAVSKEAYSTVAGEEGYEAHLAAVAKAAAANPAVQESLTVFLGGFPFGTPKSQLYLDFGGGGKIMKLVIPKDAEGRRQGVAFITFKTKEDVEAVCKLDRTEYGGRILKVNRVAPREGGYAGNKGRGKAAKGQASFDHEVTVRGLPRTTTSEEVKNHFKACGEVVNLKLLYNDEGKVRGTAFVAFNSKDAMQKAVEINNTEFGGRTIYVSRAGDFGRKGKDGKAKGKGKGNDNVKGLKGEG